MPHLSTLAQELSLSKENKSSLIRAEDYPQKIRLTIPTKWCPPLHDEDGYLHPEINPYDRQVLFPHPGQCQLFTPNLLDLVDGSPRIGGSLNLREAVSPTGQDFLDCARNTFLSDNDLDARLKITEVVVLDMKDFKLGRPCDVRIEFAVVKA